jgi:excisionase family DNA binding protein
VNSSTIRNGRVSGFGEELLTVSEVAGALKVKISWVYERTRRSGRDRMPHLKLGKYLRFRWPEVQEWLEQLSRN